MFCVLLFCLFVIKDMSERIKRVNPSDRECLIPKLEQRNVIDVSYLLALFSTFYIYRVPFLCLMGLMITYLHFQYGSILAIMLGCPSGIIGLATSGKMTQHKSIRIHFEGLTWTLDFKVQDHWRSLPQRSLRITITTTLQGTQSRIWSMTGREK